MSDLPPMLPLTPLGGRAPREDRHGPVILREETKTALASFAARRGQEAVTASVLADLVGAEAPGPGQAVMGATLGAFWLGPDQWMVTAPHHSHEDLAAQLSQAAARRASVTEQSDAWCRFDLTGERLADVFERLCPVNLRAWTGGAATRTSIDHLGCLVVMPKPEHVTVFGPRSAAGSLHHALLTAMRSAL